ncbi:hypothetical protein [Methylovirgula sp. 4M-Z18]|uniref:hypothetical protein n=1 Tax=Methylovirgula sp. 4M-Z18 TaxID=2293567 RepID=UPI001314F4EA|nr:hypothetical protein [Methylovirgula sp. 4M-Z18]
MRRGAQALFFMSLLALAGCQSTAPPESAVSTVGPAQDMLRLLAGRKIHLSWTYEYRGSMPRTYHVDWVISIESGTRFSTAYKTNEGESGVTPGVFDEVAHYGNNSTGVVSVSGNTFTNTGYYLNHTAVTIIRVSKNGCQVIANRNDPPANKEYDRTFLFRDYDSKCELVGP